MQAPVPTKPTADVSVADVPLAKASHMAKSTVNMGRNHTKALCKKRINSAALDFINPTPSQKRLIFGISP